jgi:hypothetical protein
MTWTRLSDDYADRPNVMALSSDAFRAHIEALVWSNKHLTNGAVPAVGLRRIVSAEDLEAVSAELVQAGLWQLTPDGFQIDWSEQENAEQVTERRDEWQRRQKRQRHHNKGDHALCDPKRCHYLIAHPEAVTRDSRSDSPPPIPLPSPVPDHQGGRGTRKDAPDARSASAPRAPRVPEERKRTLEEQKRLWDEHQQSEFEINAAIAASMGIEWKREDHVRPFRPEAES